MSVIPLDITILGKLFTQMPLSWALSNIIWCGVAQDVRHRLGGRARFTASGAPVHKNVGAPIIWIPPSPDCLYRHSSHHRHYVEDPCCNAHYYWSCTGNEPRWLHELAIREHGHYDSLWCQRATQNHFLYSLIINLIFLTCYRVAKKWKKIVLLWGNPFLWGPCSAEHAKSASAWWYIRDSVTPICRDSSRHCLWQHRPPHCRATQYK